MAVESRLPYQRRWHAEHRQQVNDKRRQRYKRSPGLRNANRARCRRYYREVVGMRPPVPMALHRKPIWADFKIGGKTVRILVVTVGYFAYRLGIKPMTLALWEKRNYLPRMNWRSKTGARVWPLLFIDICAECLHDLPVITGRNASKTNVRLYPEIVKRWNEGKIKYLTEPNYGVDRIEATRPINKLRSKNAAKEAAKRAKSSGTWSGQDTPSGTGEDGSVRKHPNRSRTSDSAQ